MKRQTFIVIAAILIITSIPAFLLWHTISSMQPELSLRNIILGTISILILWGTIKNLKHMFFNKDEETQE